MSRAFATPCAERGCPSVTRDDRCPEHARAFERRRGTPAQRGYDRAWRFTRRMILRRDLICRIPIGCCAPSTEVDHIIPRRQGGTDDPSNLQGLCKRHHSAKTAREDGRWGS